MAQFNLTISDADVTRVTDALCGTFNISYFHQADPTLVGPDAAKAVVIDILQHITVQAETAAAQATIVPPDMS